MRYYFAVVLLILTFLACGSQEKEADQVEPEETTAQAEDTDMSIPEIKVTSSCFIHEGMIPSRCTCDGDDQSPELFWKNIPENTQSLAVVCDDPDAPGGTWIHWVLFNVPASDTGIHHNVKAREEGYHQGVNSWGKNSYGGPCPPSGTHRYYFKVYALDTKLDLEPEQATKAKLLEAMEGHIIARGEIMGRYQRQ